VGELPVEQAGVTARELGQQASHHLENLVRIIGQLQQISSQAAGPAPPASDPRLTPRENHVLNLLVQGSSNRRIARELAISESTVKNHLHAIFLKLGVRDRTEAISVVLSTAPRPGRPAD
jgi:DNA-binding NarL/FixJ family response regulator